MVFQADKKFPAFICNPKVQYHFHIIHSMQWDKLLFTKPKPAQHIMYNINMLYLLQCLSAGVFTPIYLKPTGYDTITL